MLATLILGSFLSCSMTLSSLVPLSGRSDASWVAVGLSVTSWSISSFENDSDNFGDLLCSRTVVGP